MKKKNILIILLLAMTLFGISMGYGVCKVSSNLSNNKGIENKEQTTSAKENSKEVIELEINKLNEVKNNKYMILVNKDNKLSSTHVPEDLIKSDIPFQSHIETRSLNKTVSNAAKEMFDAAKKDGINLLGASGYREYSVQKNMFDKRVKEIGEKKAGEYLAPPGSSEHQTGYAIDILSKEYGALDSKFEETEAFKWLNENCYKYGFILRYPKDKEEITKFKYEPWHYRYIGNEAVAKEIMTNGICFEEYIDELNKKIENLQKTIE